MKHGELLNTSDVLTACRSSKERELYSPDINSELSNYIYASLAVTFILLLGFNLKWW